MATLAELKQPKILHQRLFFLYPAKELTRSTKIAFAVLFRIYNSCTTIIQVIPNFVNRVLDTNVFLCNNKGNKIKNWCKKSAFSGAGFTHQFTSF